MAPAAAAQLTFPLPPPWPIAWDQRAAYVHWWLCVFMAGVGALKAAGFLRHDLSQIVGVLELIGGAVLLPRWKVLVQKLGISPGDCVRFGTWMCLLALGIIVSTKKRRSPVCWSQTLLCMDLLRAHEGLPAVGFGTAVLVAGTLSGLLLGRIFGLDTAVVKAE
eukprot:gnl/TRDRNA2_/TRDRNA2_66356_c0_seq1.p1 gnl/TRDRNA2_/TRDRNA2_66356_c0~~gnl/TRDRNA2_/TRDRNA2_66356_c0_seq1.p1  ORF type:complete len:163 (-),score=28.81 gnl/TRDRNA2_/TRDRNA2_66356_c0_seq1:100-588(-)